MAGISVLLGYHGRFTGGHDKELGVAVACFGLIGSVVWSLANRASKYWHALWLKKVQRAERDVLSTELFGTLDDPAPQRILWGGARYSVTTLTIALSYFAVMLWVILTIKAASLADWSDTAKFMIAGALLWIFLIALYARSARAASLTLGKRNGG